MMVVYVCLRGVSERKRNNEFKEKWEEKKTHKNETRHMCVQW